MTTGLGKVAIPPSPKILKVLGEIEFEPWQCIAELVDNAFDDFLDARRSGVVWVARPRVDVSIPLANTPLTNAEVRVEDNGQGMSIDNLTNAVRAGWSSNDPFTSLGLFGMGFNVATARLGSLIEMVSTRDGDSEWRGIRIDLDNLGDDFAADEIVEPKSDITAHGTRVAVRRLKSQQGTWLQRNAAHLGSVLGAIYSYLLEQEAFELLVNGVEVKPRRPCVWDSERSVTYGSGVNQERIPAVIVIDEPLPAADICMACRNWQEPPGVRVCKECGGTTLVQRPRRIHGWIGIQRYLHKQDFGIDVLRNGRKILRYDKRLFEWKDPNNPSATSDVEYPVELTQGGRIVGEIHLDHVPVNYHKDAFEWNDRNWIAAVNVLRGLGPLLPRKARDLGYPDNQSPLARLHRGYRRTDAGQRCLIPGDGSGPIHDKTREWALRFYGGDPDFQTDAKWWEAVVYHDEEKRRREEADRARRARGLPPLPRTGQVLVELGLGPIEDGGSGAPEDGQPVAEPHESEQERIQRYKENGTVIPSLTGDFGLIELNRSIHVTTYDVTGQGLVDGTGHVAPVVLSQEPRSRFSAFVDSSHRVFREFPGDGADYFLIELANHLRIRADHDMPLSEVVAQLKLRHLVDRKLDQALLAGRAQEVLRSVRERMVHAIAANPERAWQFLSVDEVSATEATMVSEGVHMTPERARATGEFVSYAPPMFLARLIEEWSETFLDGKVFAGPYATVASPTARRVSVARVSGYLYDVARLVIAVQPAPKDELARAQYSIELLEAEMTSPAEEVEASA